MDLFGSLKNQLLPKVLVLVNVLIGASLCCAVSVSAGQRVESGLVALYEFEEGTGNVVNDSSGVAPPLNLTIDDVGAVAWVSGGLIINSETVISSATAATKIISAAKLSNEITVEAWVQTSDLSQNGPARIVSISGSSVSRNLTMGQGVYNSGGDRIETRLRSTSTSNNGTPATTTPVGSIDMALVQIVYTRDAAGSARLLIDGVEQGSRLVGGTLSSWSDAQKLMLANEKGGGRKWLGEYQLLAFYDRALSDEEIDQNFIAGPTLGPDTTAPAINDINVSVFETSATITWTTDEAATSVADYGEDTDYTLGSISNNSETQAHSVTLTGLTGSTDYHAQLTVVDSVGLSTTSNDVSFTTTAAPIVYALSVTTSGAGTGQINPASGQHNEGVIVEITATPDSGSEFVGWSGGITSNQNPLSITMDQAYSVVANFQLDSTPPVISDITVSASTSSALVTWTTNEPATSELSYGETDSYEIGSVVNGSFTQMHTAQIIGLSAGATYLAKIVVEDMVGLTTTLTIPSIQTSTTPQRITGGLIALYEFEEAAGSVVLDTSGFGTPLDLQVSNTNAVTWVSGGLIVDSETSISSSVPASKIIDAVKLSNELTVEAWIKTSSLDQNGPARIVSISASSSKRNITIGQGVYGSSGDRLETRLRTTATSNNGTPATTTAVGSLSTDLTHVVYTRDASGAARLLIDGSEQGSRLASGTLANWDDSQMLLLANEAGSSRKWLGEYQLVAFYNKALSVAEVEQNFAAGPVVGPDVTPPSISNINVSALETSATITWTTDETATSIIDYGEDTDYTMGSINQGAATLTHSITLSGLIASTNYHAQLTAFDGAGLSTTSADIGFTTDAVPAVYELIMNTNGGGNSQAIPSASQYSEATVVQITAIADAGFEFIGWTGDVTSNLNPLSVTMDQAYTITANFEQDSTPPVISDVNIDASPTGAMVTWTTNEPATSVLNYGETSSYEIGSVSNNNPTQSHFAQLIGLVTDTSYQAEIIVQDLAGLMTTLTINSIQATNAPQRVSNGLIALYEFDEGAGNIISDTSGVGASLDLQINNTDAVSWFFGGLTVNSETVISSGEAASKIIDAVKQSNALTVEAWIKTMDLDQNGPARIISISESSSSRNLTLGQGVYNAGGDRFETRLRTTATNRNGTPATTTPAGSLGEDLTHVVYTRDASGQARTFINGAEQGSRQVGGTLANWGEGQLLFLANEAGLGREWRGDYELVAFYNRALSPEEVTLNLYAGADGDGELPTLAPIANISTDTTSGLIPLAVSFDASASSATEGGIVSYAWDFGDGYSDVGVTSSHNYATAGTFTATLTVTDSIGQSTTTSVQIQTQVFSDIPELVFFDWSGPVTKAWHGFPSEQPPRENGDLTAPYNYGEGTFHIRAEIFSQPIAQNMRLQFCVWQPYNGDAYGNEQCGKLRSVTGNPGSILTWSETEASMWVLHPIEWDRSRTRVSFVVKNSDNDPISDYLGWNWFGEDPDAWYPLNIRFTIILVAKGQVFSGWNNYSQINE